MIPRILVVEDDPVSRELLSSLLASRGYETDTADDGFSALKLAQETSYDLIFIDYHLPEMDGYALARLLRALGEKTNAVLKMVAITADQFGLAARRGVDTIFDRVLSKPIEPDALFAFVDEFLGATATLDAVESFLARKPELVEDAPNASLALWRTRGLSAMPRAAIFPAPTANERTSLEQCFRLVEPEAADCLILLRPAGLAAIEALRTEGPCFLQPLVVIDPELAPMANALFDPSNGESWTSLAKVLGAFAMRRRSLRSDAATTVDFAARVAAYLFLAERPLELIRGEAGETTVPFTAGFPAPALIEAVKALATRGLVAAKLEAAAADGSSRLVVTPTARLAHQMSSGAALGGMPPKSMDVPC